MVARKCPQTGGAAHRKLSQGLKAAGKISVHGKSSKPGESESFTELQ